MSSQKRAALEDEERSIESIKKKAKSTNVPASFLAELAFVEPEAPPLPATLERVKKSLTCPICRELLTDPQRLPCDHVFCFGCLTSLNHTQPTCPTCKMTSVEFKSDPVLDSVCQSMRPQKCAECSVTYFGDLRQHMHTVCSKTSPCSFCNTVVFTDNMTSHHDVCPSRPIACLGCKAEFPRNQHATHQLKCPWFATCCGKVFLLREFQEHLRTSSGSCVDQKVTLCPSIVGACKYCGSKSHPNAIECPFCVQCLHCDEFYRKDLAALHLRRCESCPVQCEACSVSCGKPTLVSVASIASHERIHHDLTPFSFTAKQWEISPRLATAFVRGISFQVSSFSDASFPTSGFQLLDRLEEPGVNHRLKLVPSVFLLRKQLGSENAFTLSTFRLDRSDLNQKDAIVRETSILLRGIEGFSKSKQHWDVSFVFPRHSFYIVTPRLSATGLHMLDKYFQTDDFTVFSRESFVLHEPEKSDFQLMRIDANSQMEIQHVKVIFERIFAGWRKAAKSPGFCEIVAVQPKGSQIHGSFKFKLSHPWESNRDLNFLKTAYSKK